jgi:hypothetical protein
VNDELPVSDWTVQKQEAYRRYLTVECAIVAQIQRKYPSWGRWFYFELTAGPGLLQSNGQFIKGSPIIALEIFRQTPGLSVDCLLVEQNPIYAEQLHNAIMALIGTWTVIERSRVRINIKCFDHRELLKWRGLASAGSLGFVYWDGLGRDIYPTHELRNWLGCYTRHDLLIMGSSTAQKRTGRARFDRMLLTVPRKEVWISEPNGNWEWIFALGTGWSPLPSKFSAAGIVLHPWNSPKGKEIRDTLGTTRNQRRDRSQMPLWTEYQTYEEYLRHPRFLAVRAEAFKRAGGRCERCGAIATEPHHLRYPPWGEFDTVDDLLVVCHDCHCWIEGKES